MTKLIIVDDHPIFRSGLKQILNAQIGMEVVAEAGNAQQLYRVLNKTKWDVIILDIGLKGETGLDILKELKERLKKVSVLFLSNYPESQYGIRALKAGAAGYITKENAAREVVKAIRKIAAGGRYVSPTIAEKLADDLKLDVTRPAHEILSSREFQVMCLLASGKTVKVIAQELGLSMQTVSTYKSRILEKLGFTSNAEIIRYALENQII